MIFQMKGEKIGQLNQKAMNKRYKLFQTKFEHQAATVVTLQVKYKEEEKRNTDKWNNYFDKLRATYEKEQEPSDVYNLLKYADK